LKPLAAIPAAVVKNIRGVFCDIDDTLTSEGKLTARAYGALERLGSGGKLVIPITGRPVGWSEPFARAWPVDAIVPENGAVALQRSASGTLTKLYQQDAATRSSNYQRMQQVLAAVLQRIPALADAETVGADLMAITRAVCDTAGQHGDIDAVVLERRVERAVFGYLEWPGSGR